MRDSLQQICDRFVENRQTVRRQFRMGNAYLTPLCAGILCAGNVAVSDDTLADRKALLRQKTGAFSYFRGSLTAPLACMLATDPDPSGRVERAVEAYACLKEHFWGSPYLALVAFLLAGMGDEAQTPQRAARGKALYRLMKREHPFLTAGEDSVFAVLLAFADQSDEDLIREMEIGYALLKQRFSASNAVQSVTHVLTLAPGQPQDKAARLIALYDALRDAGARYGRNYELSTLAAVSVLGVPIDRIVSDLLEVDGFLSVQRGYGVFGPGRRARLMHAAMLTVDDLGTRPERATAQNAALTGTLAMIAAQQAAMCTVIAATTATGAASS